MASKVRIMRKRCTCHQILGAYQRDFEDAISKGEPPVKLIKEKFTFWNKMCCRVNVLNPPFYAVVNVEEKRNIKEYLRDENTLGFSSDVEYIEDVRLTGLPQLPLIK